MRLLFCALTALLVASCSEPVVNDVVAADETETRPLIQDRFRLYPSELDHQTTLNRLLQSLDRRDLTVFALIDHQAGANSVDLEMPPATLVIFGNPQAGTRLMLAEPLMGAELPLRALIYEDEGQVMLAVTGMDYLEREYGLADRSEVINRVAAALNTIATEATEL